jgi:hypothetical protein
MSINRRHLILPAIVAGLVGVTLALAGSMEEDAVAKNVEAFRAAQIAADAKALDALVAAEVSYSHSDGRIEDKATFIANLPTENRNSWCWSIWTRKFAWSAVLQSCGSTGWPKARPSPTVRRARAIFTSS